MRWSKVFVARSLTSNVAHLFRVRTFVEGRRRNTDCDVTVRYGDGWFDFACRNPCAFLQPWCGWVLLRGREQYTLGCCSRIVFCPRCVWFSSACFARVWRSGKYAGQRCQVWFWFVNLQRFFRLSSSASRQLFKIACVADNGHVQKIRKTSLFDRKFVVVLLTCYFSTELLHLPLHSWLKLPLIHSLLKRWDFLSFKHGCSGAGTSAHTFHVLLRSVLKVKTSLNTDWKMSLKCCWKWLVVFSSIIPMIANEGKA